MKFTHAHTPIAPAHQYWTSKVKLLGEMCTGLSGTIHNPHSHVTRTFREKFSQAPRLPKLGDERSLLFFY